MQPVDRVIKDREDQRSPPVRASGRRTRTPDDPRPDPPLPDVLPVSLRTLTTEHAAFAESYVRHVQALLRFACRDVDADTADDLVAAAFISLWHRCQKGVGPPADEERAYLMAAVRNRIQGHRRARKALARLGDRAGEWIERARDAMHPAAVAERNVDMDRVRVEMRGMPKKMREVLTLVLEDLTPNEIASMLGVTESTVRVHHCDGIKWLKRRLAPVVHDARGRGDRGTNTP